MKPALAVLFLGSLLGTACGQNPAGPSESRPPAAGAGPRPGAPAASPAAGVRLLYDARDRATLPPGVERKPKLAPEVEKRVLSALSPSYKTKREECAAADDVVLRVTATAAGSFTTAAAKETAYVVASRPCPPAERQPIADTHLLVFDGEKLVVQTPKGPPAQGEPAAFVGTDIRAVVDLDQDGVSELLVTATGAGEGAPHSQETARLYATKGGALKLVKEFPAVYLDGCAGDQPSGKVQAHVLRYAPAAKGSTPAITSEAYEAACPASGGPKPADFKPVKPPSPAPSEAATR